MTGHTNPNAFRPPQGAAINFIPQDEPNAELHMQKLGNEIIGPDFKAGWNTVAGTRHPEKPEDCSYVNRLSDGSMVYALFDGAGSYGGGQEAAFTARQELHDQARSGLLSDLAGLFGKIADRVDKSVPGNCTTGLLVIVSPADARGKHRVRWGAVGDSLAFGHEKGAQLANPLNKEESSRQQILDRIAAERRKPTKEEVEYTDSVGHVVTNALGLGAFRGLSQFGELEAGDGFTLVLSSDGITGDKSHQRMFGAASNEEAIAQELNNKSLSPLQKVANIIYRSNKKHDDQTAMVVELIGNKAKLPEAAPAPTLAGELGVIDGRFRIKMPEGGIEDNGWSVVKKGTRANPNSPGGREAIYMLRSEPVLDPVTQKPVIREFAARASDIVRWQTEMKSERAEIAERRRQAQASQQELMAGNARQIINAVPDNLRPVVDSVQVAAQKAPEAKPVEIVELGRRETKRALKSLGLKTGSPVIIERGRGDDKYFMQGAVVEGMVTRDGVPYVRTAWNGLDPATNTMQSYGKDILPQEMARIQDDYRSGRIKLTRGTGIVINQK